MAYTLLGTNRWASEPVIDISLYYDHRRAAGTQQYKFKTVISALLYSGSYYGYAINQTITLDGIVSSADQLKKASPSHWSSAITYETDWIDFQKTSGTVSASFEIKGGNGHKNTYSYSLAVDILSSTITVPSTGTLGEAFTISISRVNQSYVDDLSYTCGSASGTIASGISAASYSYTPPVGLAAQSPYYSYVTLTVTCTTRSGANIIGTSQATIQLTIPASVKPSCAVSITDLNSYYDTYGGYVSGKSQLQLTIEPILAYNSPISTYAIQYDGISSIAIGNTFTVNVTDANTIAVTVTDMRGRSGTLNQPIDVLTYSVPQITSFDAYRCDGAGVRDDEGSYMKISGTFVVSPLNNRNSKVYKAIYKHVDDSVYTEVVLDSSSYTQTTVTTPIAIDSSAYLAGFRVTDDFYTSANPIDRTVNVGIAFVLMDFKASGRGIGIGTYSTVDNLLDIAMDVNISGDLTVNGQYPGDYEALSNKPSIEGVTLSGNKTLSDLGISQIYTVIGTQNASTNAWLGNLPAVSELFDGLTILYFLPYAGTSTAATLKLTLSGGAQTGAIPVYYTGTSGATTHYAAGSTILLTYWSAPQVAGTVGAPRWSRADYSVTNSNTVAQVSCATAAATAAKTATSTYFYLVSGVKTWFTVQFRYANTYKGKVTLNINSIGAYDVYLNGNITSATNYDIKRMTYIAYFDGSHYYLRTDGRIDGIQSEITDLATIRAGAALGATSVQPGDLSAVAFSGEYSDLYGRMNASVSSETLNLYFESE